MRDSAFSSPTLVRRVEKGGNVVKLPGNLPLAQARQREHLLNDSQLFAGPTPRDGLDLVSSAELQQKNGGLLASECPWRLLSEAAEVCHGSRPGRNLTGAMGESRNAGSVSVTGPERRRQQPHFTASSLWIAPPPLI